jgi:asparagine synthase (glutamine-hydrolysing)
MCGISGFLDHSETLNQVTLNKYCEVMNHRGPNDKGIHFQKNEFGNIGLAHVRLSILDLSAHGHQPMHYKQYSLVLNGEIYNFKEIRQTLLTKGYSFNSETDTEVVLKAFDCWGLDCVAQFIGMFAFVIYDTINEEVFCVRDRAGIKPFFYYWHNNLFLFASELKAFHQHPKFIKELNDDPRKYLNCKISYYEAPKEDFPDL